MPDDYKKDKTKVVGKGIKMIMLAVAFLLGMILCLLSEYHILIFKKTYDWTVR